MTVAGRQEDLFGRAEADKYLVARESIPLGESRKESYAISRARLLELFGGTEDGWNDWRWQMKHRLHELDQLEGILTLTPRQRAEIALVSQTVRWSISPYFAALLDPERDDDPLRLQAVPSAAETSDTLGELDPMAEEATSPCPLIARRYPDRLIIKVTDCCAMYCRHCQRRRLVGLRDRRAGRRDLERALQYVRENPEIRDVLLSGGDPLTLEDSVLDWILRRLDDIPHVEIKRIGTRLPVTLPQRITDRLCGILKQHAPLYLNTQFNHPLEVTPEAAAACSRLADAGVVLGNQSVLLKGVNDDPYVIRRLNHELLKMRVRPYYLFHAKPVRGTSHFRTTIDRGLEIMADLRGRTSGLAIPAYVFNVPGGRGKVPLLPDYLVYHDEEVCVLRTWRGDVVTISDTLPEAAAPDVGGERIHGGAETR